MHSDEQLIADRNMRIVAQALIETINALRNVSVCGGFEYSYIRKLKLQLSAGCMKFLKYLNFLKLWHSRVFFLSSLKNIEPLCLCRFEELFEILCGYCDFP